MAFYESSPNADSILPPEYGQLVIQPLMQSSVAARILTVLRTSAYEYRVPVVNTDPVAEFVNEGDEITPSQPLLQELTVRPAKLAGLTIISRELAEDSSPAAAKIVGDGLARDIARKLDDAVLGTVASPAPAGLGTLSGMQSVTGAGVFNNLDAFAEALSLAETVGATVTAFVTGPATALALGKVKNATGSNQPLLGMDATSATSRQILGVPLYVSSAVAANTVYAVDSSRSFLVMREGVQVAVSTDAYFSSDRIGVKATMRVAPGFAHPASVVKISTA